MPNKMPIWKKTFLYVVLILVSVITLLPLVWMLSSSLKLDKDVFRIPIEWIPSNPAWSNYQRIWKQVPLLYQASRLTGDPTYHNMAYSHARQAQKYLVRPDHSTYHTYFMDVETGAPRYGSTAQGFSDNSCWARGQAWGVYGFALSYAHTGDESFLDTACQVLDYFLAHLPEDQVCYWDLCFTEGSQPRDSSAAAITCCGIHELLRHLPADHPCRPAYEKALGAMMASLAQSYTTRNKPQADGILLHGVYSMPHNRGVDESTIWGDYYYLEALFRLYYGECGFWI